MSFSEKLNKIFEVSGMENKETLFLFGDITSSFQKKYIDMLELPKEDVLEVEDNPHMTFIYLPPPITGITEEKLFEVTGSILKGKTFDIKTSKFHVFKGVGFNNKKNQADVLVVKLDVPSELRKCRKEVMNAIITAGGKFEETYPNYEPHMTIAYFKKGVIPDKLPSFAQEAIKISSIDFQFGGSDKKVKKFL